MLSLTKKFFKDEYGDLKSKLTRSIEDTLTLQKIFNESFFQIVYFVFLDLGNIVDAWHAQLKTLESAQQNKLIESIQSIEQESNKIRVLKDQLQAFDEFKIKLYMDLSLFFPDDSYQQTNNPTNHKFTIKTEQLKKRLPSPSPEIPPYPNGLPDIVNAISTNQEDNCLLCITPSNEQLGSLFIIQIQGQKFCVHKVCAFWTKGIYYSEVGKHIFIKNRMSIKKSLNQVNFQIKKNQNCTICGLIGASIRCILCKDTIVHYPCMTANNTHSNFPFCILKVEYNEQLFTFKCSMHFQFNKSQTKSRSRSIESQRSITHFFKQTSK